MNYKLLFQSIGAMLIIGGAIALYLAATQLARKMRSSHWPWVDAKILSINYREFYTSVTDSSDKMAEIRLSYEYKTEESIFKSDQISIGKTKYKREAESVTFLKNCRVGDIIKVHYNPTHPEQAAVITGTDILDYFYTVCAALTCYVGFKIFRRKEFKKTENGKARASA